ncbi:OmcA/MtrC family decaheme c-type cytochrome [Thalassotalea sp. ND16A]|uniref:OmcA/MtrC family decaheme c-type cytochrome n=1 Tax=Thalassotalea sp. ND16A TaxID=1535422 RepID=UPI00051A521A|nr:OmcA/MtrC family decaheme c-type cytochrome [Thalassotalea sp. ND16A]KGJ98427.1 hypothetical protein ND16A_0736 [Thalassotalea sp. ND16A]
MKNMKLWHLKQLLTSVVLIGILALFGCGDDGATGPAGPDGPTGSVGETGPSGSTGTSRITETMESAITGATIAIDGKLTVDFSIEDDIGVGFNGLQGSQIRFTVAQLTPIDATSGESSYWQSYINKTERAPTDPINGPGTEDAIQATSENASTEAGIFINNKDGTYSYTFSFDMSNVTSPVAVIYNPDYTQRVAFQISGNGYPTMNRTYDWQPSTGATDSISSREMVSQGTCNNCHGELAFHGGGRVDTAYCVTCHNPGSGDANSGETVDFKVMIHRIHRGANLPSVINGGEFAIWGYRDSKHDYSATHLPQDIRNCSNCHDDSNVATPDAINWMQQPTMQACGSCHDNVDFATGTGHLAGVQADNSECQTCHGESGFSSVRSNHVGIMDYKDIARTAIVTKPEAVRVDLATGDIEVDVMITLEGAPVTALRDSNDIDTPQGAMFGKYGHGTDNGALALNWDDGTGYQLNHQEVAFNDCTPDGAGLFSCSAPGLLAGITATDVITATPVDVLVCMNEKDGAIVRCDSPETASMDVAQIESEPTIAFFNGDGSISTEAYDKIGANMESCQGCHADKMFHHGATDLIQCKTCHNATRTGFRGLGDLKRHVHRLHSGLDKDALDDENPEQIDHFPNNIDNCNACHAEGQFDLPIQQNTRASAASGANDSVYVSPTAVVCGSCHLNVKLGLIDPNLPGLIDPGKGAISTKNQSLIDHMIQNGAIFGSANFAAANKVESCSVCHGIGAEFAVDKMHTLH